MYQGMLEGLSGFADRLRRFRQQITVMTEKYFEPLGRRNGSAYAKAYSRFYADMISVNAWVFNEEFEQNFPLEVSFVPMMHPNEDGKVFVAEKAIFTCLTDFLPTEFYRGLAIGSTPRRCHNCGRYFLLTVGYNICSCGNVAPGETERTCRKVGAHRKETQNQAGETPERKEYRRTYNRLKQKKLRGKISADEWNAAVAQAQELLSQTEREELGEEELKQKPSAF